MAVQVNTDECIGCGACVDSCPMDAITVNDHAEVDEDACIECGACTGSCPVEALSL